MRPKGEAECRIVDLMRYVPRVNQFGGVYDPDPANEYDQADRMDMSDPIAQAIVADAEATIRRIRERWDAKR